MLKERIKKSRRDKIPENIIIEALKFAAIHFNYRKFTKRQFDSISPLVKSTTIIKHFDGWENALQSITKVPFKNIERSSSASRTGEKYKSICRSRSTLT